MLKLQQWRGCPPFDAYESDHAHNCNSAKEGVDVLVVGASGAVGTAAVQIARHFGADVTGVTSTSNVKLVADLGAQRVIDYTQTDFATTGETWDIIVDTTGTVAFARCDASLGPGGRLIAIQGSFAQTLGFGRRRKRVAKRSSRAMCRRNPKIFDTSQG